MPTIGFVAVSAATYCDPFAILLALQHIKCCDEFTMKVRPDTIGSCYMLWPYICSPRHHRAKYPKIHIPAGVSYGYIRYEAALLSLSRPADLAVDPVFRLLPIAARTELQRTLEHAE